MKQLPKKLILSLSTFVANSASLYVAPNGSNDNDGSQSNPFATISYASTKAQPGDKVAAIQNISFYSQHKPELLFLDKTHLSS